MDNGGYARRDKKERRKWLSQSSRVSSSAGGDRGGKGHGTAFGGGRGSQWGSGRGVKSPKVQMFQSTLFIAFWGLDLCNVQV
jgi:hypothetical protein